ncbi:MAG TPA: hypothetical protein VKY57_12085 [Chitinispirillaceae bacterium]|nr:hypothetical protein [Chitinispirillaceae bacterium]
MKRLVTVLLAGAICLSAQEPVETRTQGCTEDLAAKLQQKLNEAVEQADGELIKAQEAVKEFQKKMKGMSDAQKSEMMEQNRAKIQQQLQTAIQQLEQVSARIALQVANTGEQIQTRLQEKTTELKQIQERINSENKAKYGTDK